MAYLLFAAVDGALHDGHARRSPGRDLRELRALGNVEIEVALLVEVGHRRLRLVLQRILFADQQARLPLGWKTITREPTFTVLESEEGSYTVTSTAFCARESAADETSRRDRRRESAWAPGRSPGLSNL